MLPRRALALEVAENEQRRDFTGADVARAADKLRALGYRDTPGRPKAGEKALRPALSAIFRVSRSTIARALAGREKGSSEPVSASPQALMLRMRRAAEAAVVGLEGARGSRAAVRKLAGELVAAIDRAMGDKR